MMNKNLFFGLGLGALLISGLLIFYPSPVFASTTDGTIDSTDQYAWSENIGWINFGTTETEGDVHITDSALTGYAYGENIGWISLNCSNDDSCATIDYGISNDGEGNLSGYAWSENTGWIDFDPTGGGVTIDSDGDFAGYAYGENIGWLVFNCATTDSCNTVDYKVSTDWRPQSARGAATVEPGQLDELVTLGYVTVQGQANNTTQATFSRQVVVEISTSQGTAQVSTPSQTVTTKSGGGSLDFTQLSAADATGSVSGISGQSALTAIRYGIADITLSFDQNVTITLPVGSTYNGSTLNVYRSNSSSSGWSLLTTCTVSSGNCSFTTTSASYFAATRAASGGGGGSSNNPPTPPAGGFQILMNDGATITNSRVVTLKLQAGPDSKKMAISRYVDFRDASQEELASSKIWDLCPSLNCPEGDYIIYAKFYSQSGQPSQTVSSRIKYQKITTAPKPAETKKQPTSKLTEIILSKNLKRGTYQKEVLLLQKALNLLGFKVSNSDAGSPGKETNFFGLKTYQALIKFQETYQNEILKPLGLKRGTGFFGGKTRELINKLLSKSK